MEWPAKRCYVGLFAVGVQKQTENVLVPPLLRNCLTFTITFPFPSHYLPPQNSGPCNSFYCLGHFKYVYDDDDDEQVKVLAVGFAASVSAICVILTVGRLIKPAHNWTTIMMKTTVPRERVDITGQQYSLCLDRRVLIECPQREGRVTVAKCW